MRLSESIYRKLFLVEAKIGPRQRSFMARISIRFEIIASPIGVYPRHREIITDGIFKKSIQELDTYAKERWDSLLSYLARGNPNGKVSQEIIYLLQHAKLCEADGETRFQFLLLDR